MKKILLFLGATLLLAACTGNGNKQERQQSDILALDSISNSTSLKVGNQTIQSEVEIVFPKDLDAIRNDLTELVKKLGQDEAFEGYPDSVKVDTTDMISLVNYLVSSKADWLKNEFADEEAEPDDIPLVYEMKINVLEETEKYITMGVKESILFGGPRPRFTTYGITYLKPDGKKIDSRDMESDKTDEVKKELLEKVKAYLTSVSENEDADFNVDDVFYKQNDEESVESIELPYNGFYVEGDSIVFSYQVEELVPFTFGKPEVKLSLKDMKEKGWLGKTLTDLVK